MNTISNALSINEHNRVHLYGVLLVAVSAIMFSGKAILIKIAYRFHIDAVTLMTLRMLMSLPFYLVIGFFSRGKHGPITIKQLLATIAVGVSGYYFASLFDLSGLQYITASFERLILYLYPTMVVILSAIVFRKAIKKAEYLALVVGYLGVALIFLRDQSVMGPEVTRGAIFVFLSAFTFAIFLIGSGQLSPKIGATRFTTIAMIAASVAILLHFSVANEMSDLQVPSKVYIIAFSIALFCTVIPSYLLSAGIQRIGASQGALVGALGPVSTMVLAAIVLGEILTPIHFMGMALVLLSVMTISFYRARQ